MSSTGDPVRRLAAEREQALRRLAGLDKEIAAIIAAARDANADDEHDPEGATIAFEREHAAALARQAREQVDGIDAALRRLAEGRYGICERCGGPVGAARLAARPAAASCMSCAARPR
jgi:DnaK suppressor protein